MSGSYSAFVLVDGSLGIVTTATGICAAVLPTLSVTIGSRNTSNGTTESVEIVESV